MEDVRFYRLDGAQWEGAERLAQSRGAGWQYTPEFWRPSAAHPFPPGRYDPRILSYTAMHALGAFRNGNYSMFALRAQDGVIAHSSMIMPGFSRFPFMAPTDLQIGATQTRPDHRRQGLALRAIDETIAHFGKQRVYWYLTEAENRASVSVIEKAGFTMAGTGRKYARHGLKFLGQYCIDPAATCAASQSESSIP